MGLHKIIGEGGEAYLPFALSKMRQLASEAVASAGYASRVIYADDGSIIRLRVAGGEQFIDISGSGTKYQFVCSGPFVRATVTGTLPRMHAYAVEVSCSGSEKGGLKSIPKGSTIEPDKPALGEKARWKYSSDPADISHMLSKQNIHQVECVPEYVYYSKGGSAPTGVKGHPFLMSPWTPTNQTIGALARSGVLADSVGAFDIVYDLSPSLFKRRGDRLPAGETGLVPDADWYRRATLQRVEHEEYGARTFIIMVDVANKMYAYSIKADVDYSLPAGAYADQWIKTNIEDKFVRTVQAPLPNWCRRATISGRDNLERSSSPEFHGDLPQYRWEFNSTGTEACVVIYEELPITLVGINRRPVLLAFGAFAGTPAIEVLPGLLEVELKIVITGADPEDFTFSVSTKSERRPSECGQYIVGAGYSWNVPDRDTPPKDGKGPPSIADLDDMIVMTGHIYHSSEDRVHPVALPEPPDMFSGFIDPYAAKGLIKVQNLTKGTIVRTFCVYNTSRLYITAHEDIFDGDTIVSSHARVIGYDLRILAFAVEQTYRELVKEEWSPGRFQNDYELQAKCIEVYAFNRLEEKKLLDPDSPLNDRMAAWFDDTSADGMFEFPVNDRGRSDMYRYYGPDGNDEPTPMRWLHMFYSALSFSAARGYFGRDETYRVWAHDEGREPEFDGRYASAGGFIPAGALLYAQLIFPAAGTTTTSFSLEPFTVHPNGSWSFACLPIFYYAGPYYFVGANSTTRIDLGKMKQGRVDILSIRNKGKDLRTSHLACFNEAFDKSLVEDDFLYTFSLTAVPAPGAEGFAECLVVSARPDPAAVTEGACQAYIPYFLGKNVYMHDGTVIYPISGYDIRRDRQAFRSGFSLVHDGSSFYYSYAMAKPHPEYEVLGTRTPFTRGSSLFF